MARKGSKKGGGAGRSNKPDKVRQVDRGTVFPPRTMTARQEGAAMAAAKKPPPIDWRPALSERFGIDGNLTPTQLGGWDPGEPDRYDYSDIQEAHALFHVPLWLIDASQVKLMIDYGYSTPAIFRLGILMVEENPFESLIGSVCGELFPSLAAEASPDYDPITDTVGYRDDEARFRGEAIARLIEKAEEKLTDPAHEPQFSAEEDSEILTRARRGLDPWKRLSIIEAQVSVVRDRDGSVHVLPKLDVDEAPVRTEGNARQLAEGGKPRKKKITFYIVGIEGGASYIKAFDSAERPVGCDAWFGTKGLSEAKAEMLERYGIAEQAWTDFEH